MSAAMDALRLRLMRLPLAQLEAIADRKTVPELAREVVQAELMRRRNAPTDLAGAWDVIQKSPAGTPANLDRDELRPASVVRVRSKLASLRAREYRLAIEAPQRIHRRAPFLPMRRSRHLWIPASGLVLSIEAARRLLAAIKCLRSESGDHTPQAPGS